MTSGTNNIMKNSLCFGLLIMVYIYYTQISMVEWLMNIYHINKIFNEFIKMQVHYQLQCPRQRKHKTDNCVMHYCQLMYFPNATRSSVMEVFILFILKICVYRYVYMHTYTYMCVGELGLRAYVRVSAHMCVYVYK